MYYYHAYGLTVASELHVPEFQRIDPVAKAQVALAIGDISLPRGIIRFKERRIIPHEGGILLIWKKIGAFLVKDGCRVTVMPFPESDDTGFINAILIGAVMGTILLQRGEHALFHSAVLGVEDGLGAVAFMAFSGGGKSTIATGMLKNGYSLVCDDLLVVEKDRVPVTVQPGFPGMKLWPESAENIADDVQSLPMIGKKGKYEKRTLSLEENFIGSSLPLSSVFLLDYGNVKKPLVRRMTEKDALGKLMPHWYGSLFGGDFLPILGKERMFSECSALVRQAPLFSLIRPPGMDRLDETVALVDSIRRELGKGSRI